MTGGGGDGVELGLHDDSEALFCRAREELRALGLDPDRVVREAGVNLERWRREAAARRASDPFPWLDDDGEVCT